MPRLVVCGSRLHVSSDDFPLAAFFSVASRALWVATAAGALGVAGPLNSVSQWQTGVVGASLAIALVGLIVDARLGLVSLRGTLVDIEGARASVPSLVVARLALIPLELALSAACIAAAVAAGASAPASAALISSAALTLSGCVASAGAFALLFACARCRPLRGKGDDATLEGAAALWAMRCRALACLCPGVATAGGRIDALSEAVPPRLPPRGSAAATATTTVFSDLGGAVAIALHSADLLDLTTSDALVALTIVASEQRRARAAAYAADAVRHPAPASPRSQLWLQHRLQLRPTGALTDSPKAGAAATAPLRSLAHAARAHAGASAARDSVPLDLSDARQAGALLDLQTYASWVMGVYGTPLFSMANFPSCCCMLPAAALGQAVLDALSCVAAVPRCCSTQRALAGSARPRCWQLWGEDATASCAALDCDRVALRITLRDAWRGTGASRRAAALGGAPPAPAPYGGFTILHAGTARAVGQVCWFAAVDHAAGALVVACRGSLPPEDLVTDGLAMPLCLASAADGHAVLQGLAAATGGGPALCASRCYVHLGLWLAAAEVTATLLEKGLLALAGVGAGAEAAPAGAPKHSSYGSFDSSSSVGGSSSGSGGSPALESVQPPLRLVVCGHSLGGGVAALVALQLARHAPRLTCLAYAPPGAVASPALAKALEPLVTSCVLGDDLISRMSLPVLRHTLGDMAGAIARARDSKAVLFARAFAHAAAPALLPWGLRVAMGWTRGALLPEEAVEGSVAGSGDGSGDSPDGDGLGPFSSLDCESPPARSVVAAASSSGDCGDPLHAAAIDVRSVADVFEAPLPGATADTSGAAYLVALQRVCTASAEEKAACPCLAAMQRGNVDGALLSSPHRERSSSQDSDGDFSCHCSNGECGPASSSSAFPTPSRASVPERLADAATRRMCLPGRVLHLQHVGTAPSDALSRGLAHAGAAVVGALAAPLALCAPHVAARAHTWGAALGDALAAALWCACLCSCMRRVRRVYAPLWRPRHFFHAFAVTAHAFVDHLPHMYERALRAEALDVGGA